LVQFWISFGSVLVSFWFSFGVAPADNVIEQLAVGAVLHDEVDLAGRGYYFVEVDDVGVREHPGDGLGG